jgi:subtilisin family serine protease
MSTRTARLSIVLAAIALVVGSLAVTATAGATARRSGKLLSVHHAIPHNSISHGLPRILQNSAAKLPAGVPTHGSYAFLLRLRTAPTFTAYRQHVTLGRAAASSAAKSQFARIRSQQAQVIRALPAGSRVLFRTHSALAGVAVLTDVRNYSALQAINDVTAVYAIAPKKMSNSYAMPLQGAPLAWQAHSNLGANTTIAVIDSGIDYTHADFGGGTVSYADALANDAAPVPSNAYDHAKFDTAAGLNGTPVGFYDFAGDDYNPDPTDPHYQPVPDPDHNPLDCAGHGTHVAGIAAGYGENPDGTTFTGNYLTLPTDTASYQADFRIGPGMAPQAKLLAFKVFGCVGSTSLISEAIDRAIDPNQDGDPSDHVNVINMSLGADYASPQDGDSVEANLASQLGISVVAASGNSGDVYDVAGSPADAQRVISVANSVDDYSQIDSLHVTFNGAAQPALGAERSALYDYTAKPDLGGQIYQLTDANNLTACSPLTGADLAGVIGKVALVPQWNDVNLECPSKDRADNLAAANAIGFIFVDDAESFAAGINGDTTIPGVLVTHSAGQTLETALATPAELPVVVTGTTTADFAQLIGGLDDELNTSSSRGSRGAGDVKPDVTAVGTSVFSAAMGSANQGISDSGTSMATPMVAGLAALVHTAHPTWTPEEIKADIMNTAGQDVFAGASHSGRTYAPNRVGAGRIQVGGALDNSTLAFVKDDPGAVSVSFGPVEVTGAMTLTKTVKVENKGAGPVSYTVAYHAITSVPGVSYQVAPATLTIAAGKTATFTVTFVVTNPQALTKTHDATKADSLDLGGGLVLGLETLADASGRVVLNPTSGATVPLRVPVYSAPRPASRMTQPGTVNLPGRGVQRTSVHLSGTGVNQGSGATKVLSAVAGFELNATSGTAPNCSGTVTTLCVHDAAERGADLKYVGTTSDAPLLQSPLDQGLAYFSITTQRPWTTPVGPQEFDIMIDTNGDNKPDAILYNTRLGDGDLFVSELLDVTNADPSKWFVRDDEFINDRLGSTSTFPSDTGPQQVPGADTALYDSDTMVLPLWVNAMRGYSTDTGNVPALPGFNSSHTRLHFGVVTLGEAGLVDAVGLKNSTLFDTLPMLSAPLSTDVLHPGVEVYGSLPPTDFPQSLALLWKDAPGSLTLRRAVSAYNDDHGLGALFVHFHNGVGSKAQRVTLKTLPQVSLALSASSIALHHSITATVTVANTAGRTPSGTVDVRHVGGGILRSGRLSGGKVKITVTPGRRGTYQVRAEYRGDGSYARGNSRTLTLRVT